MKRLRTPKTLSSMEDQPQSGKKDSKTVNSSQMRKHDDAASNFQEFDVSSGRVAGINSFENVLEIIGSSGRWNITMFLICSIICFVNAFQALTYEFLGATPDYWCHVGPLVDANWTKKQIFEMAIPYNDSNFNGCKMYNYNYTAAAEMGYEMAMEHLDEIAVGNDSSPIKCQSRDFDTSVYKSTVVIEWDLVCDRRALYSTTQAVTQVGTLLGSLIFGYFLDKFGRRVPVLVSVVLYLISGVASALSPGYVFYTIMRTLISFFSSGIYNGCFVFLMEICTPAQRSLVGPLFVMPWAIGYMLVPCVAYLVKPWRWLQATYSIPILFLFSHFWLLPESPRWLISQGRSEEAVKILTTAAKVNHRLLPPKEAFTASLKALTPLKKEEPKVSIAVRILNNIAYIFSLLINSDLRVKTLICFFCWFSVSMVYYGVSLNAENMSANPYIYVLLGGVVEVISYLMLIPLLIFVGRKVTLIGLYVLATVTISTIAILLGIMGEVSTGLMLFLSLSGKFAVTAAFHLVYIYTAELFPTKYRSLALGESGVMGRVGSILSPYINDILGDAIDWGPSLVFASVSTLAACFSLLLPETKGCNLTEEDAEGETSNKRKTDSLENHQHLNKAFEREV